MAQKIIDAIFGNKKIEVDEIDDPESVVFDQAMHKARKSGHLSSEKMNTNEKVEMCKKAIKRQTRNFKRRN